MINRSDYMLITIVAIIIGVYLIMQKGLLFAVATNSATLVVILLLVIILIMYYR